MEENFWIIQGEYLLRLFLAALCGCIIGHDQSSNHTKTVGMRTHAVVAMASALMTLTSKYGFSDLIGEKGISLDPSRITAGVVTAIGFLGAGVIFVRKENVTGVTTASGLWATVGVGCALGAGMYLLGIAASILIVAVQLFLLHNKKVSQEPIFEKLVLEVSTDEDIHTLFSEIFERHHIEITSLQTKRLSPQKLEIALLVRYPAAYNAEDVIKLLKDVPAIKSIEY